MTISCAFILKISGHRSANAESIMSLVAVFEGVPNAQHDITACTRLARGQDAKSESMIASSRVPPPRLRLDLMVLFKKFLKR